MLLDLDAGTLTAYVNSERKGVMVRPGMTTGNSWRAGDLVCRLQGPVCWVVDLSGSASVAIDGPLPLPA